MIKRRIYTAITSVLVFVLILSINKVHVFCGITFEGDNQNEFFFTTDEFRRAVEGENYGNLPGHKAQATASVPQTSTSTVTPAPEKKVVKTCDHTYETQIITEATCSAEGEMKFTCSKCGDTYTEKVAATGKHSYKSTVTKEATCEAEGENTFTCSECEDTYVEMIPALGHSYETKVKSEATCIEPGEIEYVCSVCGDTYTEVLPAKGHSEGEWTVTKETGLFSLGEKVKKCNVCSEILNTETIPSRYPISYLYICIGVVALFAVIAVVFIVLKKKRRI